MNIVVNEQLVKEICIIELYHFISSMRILFIFTRNPWKSLVWKVDGGFNGGTVCRRRPDNRVNLGVWFTKLYLVRKIFVYSCLIFKFKDLKVAYFSFSGGRGPVFSGGDGPCV